MSVDLWLRCPTCSECSDRTNFGINFTYNYAPMWHLATGDTRDRTVDIDGMTGEESIRMLSDAAAQVETRWAEFVELEPSNGWGSVRGFLDGLRECIDAARAAPKSVWEASR